MLHTLYIGTYTQNNASQGVYRLTVDAAGQPAAGDTGTQPTLVAPLANPSWVTLSADGQNLYAVEELPAGGRVCSFTLQADGGWQLTGRAPSGGADPCHLCLCEKEGLLFCANYTSGSLAAWQLTPEGAIAGSPAVLSHTGHGPDAVRQEGPHLHFCALAPGASALWTLDLGLDAVTVYPLTAAPTAPLARLALPAGFGPRHLVFHPRLPIAYVVGELASAVAVVELDKDGLPAPWVLQRISTLPAGFTAASWAAAVRISPDGRRLYVTNRGHDSVTTFGVGEDGALTLLCHTKTGGAWPRDMVLTPDGSALLCAHQHCAAGGITRLALDESGVPTDTVISLPAPPAPVCLCFGSAG